MNLKEFQELSRRTQPFNASPINHIEFENMLGNYSMGLAEEIIELSEYLYMNDLEAELLMLEAGDVLHYAIGLLSLLGEEVKENIAYRPISGEPLFKNPGELLGMAKKHIYHRHEYDKDKAIKLIYKVISMLKQLEDRDNWLEEVMILNIDKLKKRYPKKFTSKDSIARVDIKENK